LGKFYPTNILILNFMFSTRLKTMSWYSGLWRHSVM